MCDVTEVESGAPILFEDGSIVGIIDGRAKLPDFKRIKKFSTLK